MLLLSLFDWVFFIVCAIACLTFSERAAVSPFISIAICGQYLNNIFMIALNMETGTLVKRCFQFSSLHGRTPLVNTVFLILLLFLLAFYFFQSCCDIG